MVLHELILIISTYDGNGFYFFMNIILEIYVYFVGFIFMLFICLYNYYSCMINQRNCPRKTNKNIKFILRLVTEPSPTKLRNLMLKVTSSEELYLLIVPFGTMKIVGDQIKQNNVLKFVFLL